MVDNCQLDIRMTRSRIFDELRNSTLVRGLHENRIRSVLTFRVFRAYMAKFSRHVVDISSEEENFACRHFVWLMYASDNLLKVNFIVAKNDFLVAKRSFIPG